MRISVIAATMIAAAGAASASSVTNVDLFNGAGSELGVGEIYTALTGINLANADVNSLGAGAGSSSLTRNSIGGRISDDIDGIWRDGTIDVGFAALYWGRENTPNGSADHTISVTENNGAAVELFKAGPSHSATRGEIFSNGVFPTSSDLRFVAENDASGRVANTDATQNEGGTRDRVITFDISGLETLDVRALGLDGENIDLTSLAPLAAGKGAYLMFFETGTDNDFQDFVMLAYNVRAIPTPTAAAAGLLGLAGLATRRRR